MHRGVITVTTDTYASKAANLMAENKIGALPVVDAKNKLVGILSATDILKVFAKLEHANEKRVEKIANTHK
jgi:acetoin utilization protein AcuB